MHVIRRSKHVDRVSIHMDRIIRQTIRIRRHVADIQGLYDKEQKKTKLSTAARARNQDKQTYSQDNGTSSLIIQ